MTPSFIEAIPQGDGKCRKCGAEVQVIKAMGRKFTPTVCQSCLEEANRLAEEETFKHEYSEDKGIRPRFVECSFDSYVANGNRRALDLCRLYADAFPPSDGSGLCLHGGFGTGKTHLAVAIARSVPGAYVINCAELLDNIRKSFDDTFIAAVTLEKCMAAPLLVLDDVGQEKGSAWVWERLYILINHRYEHQLPTIFTTNVPQNQWASKWGGAIASRIQGMSTIFELHGVDYRTVKR